MAAPHLAAEALRDVMLAEAFGYGLAGLMGLVAAGWAWRVPGVGRSVLAGLAGVLCALGLRHAGLARGWMTAEPSLLGSTQLAPTPQASILALMVVVAAIATLPRRRADWQVSWRGLGAWLLLLSPLALLGARNTADIAVLRAVVLGD